MTNHEMTIKVSGVEVYKAVKNYLNSNSLIHDQIKKTVETLIESGFVKKILERQLNLYTESYSGKKTIEQAIKEASALAVNDSLKKHIDNVINQTIKKSLKNALIINTTDLED